MIVRSASRRRTSGRSGVLEANAGPFPARIADRYFKYISVLPMLILLLGLSVYPLFRLVELSFAKVSVSGGRQVVEWIGLANYTDAVKDGIFVLAFSNTAKYAFASVCLEVLCSFTLAMIVNRLRRGNTFYRTVFLLPFLIPPIVNGTMWRLLYDGQFGLINIALKSFGLNPQNWLSAAGPAFNAVIATSLWQWVGYTFLLFSAGLQLIPESVLEAAEIDGAKGLRLTTRIIIPMLKETLLVILMFRSIHAFKVFDLFYVLTGGGPGNSTEILNTYIQKVFMTERRIGYSSALSVICIVLIGAFAFLFRKAIASGDEEKPCV